MGAVESRLTGVPFARGRHRGHRHHPLKVLADNPTYTIDVVGYTDSVGTADENVTLSWRREEAVRRFLVERGAVFFEDRRVRRVSHEGLAEAPLGLARDARRDVRRHHLHGADHLRVARPQGARVGPGHL